MMGTPAALMPHRRTRCHVAKHIPLRPITAWCGRRVWFWQDPPSAVIRLVQAIQSVDGKDGLGRVAPVASALSVHEHRYSTPIYTHPQRRFDPDCGRLRNAAKGGIPGLALGDTGFCVFGPCQAGKQQ